MEPVWFQPYLDVLDTAVGGGHEVVVAGPPQHGKTQCTISALLKWLINRPDLRFGYATYSGDRAKSVADDFRLAAQRIGFELSGVKKVPRTPQGGGVFFVGRGGGATGEKINGFGIVDDIFKDDVEANSPTTRDKASHWYTKVWDTRIHPGASKIVMATRWHEDDLSGRLIDPKGKRKYRYLNIPAIAGANDVLGRKIGEALSPLWPIDTLQKKLEADRNAFWAMYQGSPVADGEKIFNGVFRYDELPSFGYRVGIGVDLAFSAKNSSDFSVIVVIHAYDIPTDDGVVTLYFITEVDRKQRTLSQFIDDLAAVLARYPGVRARWYRGGFENGVAELANRLLSEAKGVDGHSLNLGPDRIDDHSVNQDKVQRSNAVSKSWNAGAVQVPSFAPWLADFLEEVDKFSGIGDRYDDQIDALAAAHDAVESAPKSPGYFSMAEQSMWSYG